jgi:hypothetical protein
MNVMADERSAWPVGHIPYLGQRERAGRGPTALSMATCAAHLANQPARVGLGPLGDVCERTHARVRRWRLGPHPRAWTRVHDLAKIVYVPGVVAPVPVAYLTVCGVALPWDESVRTGRERACAGCSLTAKNEKRPAPGGCNPPGSRSR